MHSAPHHGPSEGWARPKRQGARITKDWPAKPKAIPTVPRDVPRRDAFSDRHPSVYLPGGEHTIQKSNGIELDSRPLLLIQIVFRLRVSGWEGGGVVGGWGVEGNGGEKFPVNKLIQN